MSECDCSPDLDSEEKIMKQRLPNPKILCCASIFALSLGACSHNGGKINGNANLADNSLTDASSHFTKLKKGHRTKGGPLPDPRSYDNLWDRLFDRFDLPETAHPDVDRELSWFINHPTYIERVQSRAEPFLYSIVKQLEKNHLPGELALLPVIESAFQPHAVSPAHAAGIWQFIPTTGRHYGLKQSHSYDGRRDIYASTRAAIKYLKKLHNDFNGDWLLAIAGYNCGEGAVARAIQRNQARGLPTDFWSLDLPQETRSYVPRLLAVAKLFSDSDQYGISLRPIPNQALYKTVKMNQQVDLALAANAADIPLNKLMELNPGFKRQHTDLDGSYRLFIPAHKKIVDFKEELARQIASQETYYGRDSQAYPASAELAGITASSSPQSEPVAIAETTTSSYLAPVETQASAAPIPPSPPAVATEETPAPISDPASQVSTAQESAPESATPAASSEPQLALAQYESSESSLGAPEITVRDYEEMAVNSSKERNRSKSWSRNGKKSQDEFVPVQHPRSLEPETLSPSKHSDPKSFRNGQKLGQKPHDEPVLAIHQRQSEPEVSIKKASYVIHEGDTVYSIARRHDMDVDDLKKMNHLSDADEIKWGQNLVVVNKDAGKKPGPVHAGGVGKPTQTTHYTAHEGETLFSISRRFNVSVAELRKWNGIKEDKQFRSGMNIKVADNKD